LCLLADAGRAFALRKLSAAELVIHGFRGSSGTYLRAVRQLAIASFRRRLRRVGLLLPRGPQTAKLGLAFTAEIPDGWTPVSQRLARSKRKAAAKERARLKRELAKQKAAAAKAG
jgi:hypothetical protein